MAATTTMPSIFFLIFIFFVFTSSSLQMPILTSTRMSFFPLDPAPPPSSHSPFFPATSTPPPPPPTTFTSRPANISSLTFPHPTTPKSTSRKLLIPALVAVISAALVTAILVLLYLRRRKHHSAFHVDTKSFLSDASNRHPSADNPDPRKQLNHSGTSSEFLYLGTLVNTRPIVERSGSGSSNARFHFRKLESPELQPLPPLNSRRRNFHDGEMFSVVVEEDAEEYYSPRGSLSGSRHGSGSRRGLGDVAADLNSSRSNTTSSNSSSSSSSGSPERSHSGSTPSPVSLSPAKSEPKSTEAVAAQTELPRAPRIRSPSLSPVFGSPTRVLAKSPQKFDKSGRALSSSPISSLLSPISSSSEASMEKDPDESPATFNHLDRNGGSPSMTWASSSPDRDVVNNFGIYDVRSFSMISTSASPPRVFDRNVASPLQSSVSSSPPRCSTKSSDASPGVSTSPDGTAQPSSQIGFSTGRSISSAPPPPPPPPACPPLPAKHVKDSVPATQNALSSNPDNEAEVEDVSKPKLKRLHWDKVRASSGREMVWDHLGSNSFKLDEEMIETLFVVNNPKNERSKEPVLPNPNQENRVLDPKKAQNIAILLRALDVTVEEVCEALLEGSIDTLGTELLENLQKMTPTKEEERKLQDYKDNFPLKLGPAERFLKAVLDVPFAFKRVDAMLYVANFESEVDYLKKSFETLEAACEELRNSRMFLKLLEAVLKTGNRMNVGTNRGDARAFKLDTLLKLVDVKGADGKTTLLHFVVQEIMRAEGERFSTMNQNSTPHEDAKCRALGLEVVSGISSELINVKKAAGMDSDVLRSESLKLSKGLERVNEVIRLLKTDSSDEKFLVSMNKFLGMADEQLIRIQAQESVALSLVKEITEYFHGNSAKEEAHPFRIFTVVRDFLSILDHVCKEVSVIDERTTSSSTNNKFPIPVNPTAQQAVPGRHAMKQQYGLFYEETATP